MQMDIRLLEAFRAVFEARSVTKASEMLGVTQPAVSAQLARLEDLVGFRLFDRDGGRLKPTAEALLFHAEVVKVLDNVAHITQAAENIRRGSLGKLVVATNPSAGISFLPALTAAYLKDHPGVSVQLITRNSDVIRGLFPSNTVDIGIAELPIDYTGIETMRYKLPCVAVLPKGHALAAQKTIRPGMLSGLPFFAISRNRPNHHEIARAFAEAHAELNLVGEAELFASVCGVVAAGEAVSIVDPWTANDFDGRLVSRPFEPSIAYEIGVFRSGDREPSKIAYEFLAIIDRELRAAGATGRRVRATPR
jgi:DNA-binding transcriptional LysR family regulator